MWECEDYIIVIGSNFNILNIYQFPNGKFCISENGEINNKKLLLTLWYYLQNMVYVTYSRTAWLICFINEANKTREKHHTHWRGRGTKQHESEIVSFFPYTAFSIPHELKLHFCCVSNKNQKVHKTKSPFFLCKCIKSFNLRKCTQITSCKCTC